MVKKTACFVSVYKNHYKGQRIRLVMAAKWIGKCHECDKWRTAHDTHLSAFTKDKDGKPIFDTRVCAYCSTPIQFKCCASGCPHCGGTGMKPLPQPPFIQWNGKTLTNKTKCGMCSELGQTNVGEKILCYGCEHEIMGYEHEHDARMMMLYGE